VWVSREVCVLLGRSIPKNPKQDISPLSKEELGSRFTPGGLIYLLESEYLSMKSVTLLPLYPFIALTGPRGKQETG
jgi:hypothetical protein